MMLNDIPTYKLYNQPSIHQHILTTHTYFDIDEFIGWFFFVC